MTGGVCRADWCGRAEVHPEHPQPPPLQAAPAGPMVDQAGRPRPLAGLNETERALYDAQLAAWEAGVEFVRAADHACYGLPVPGEVQQRWTAARADLAALRGEH